MVDAHARSITSVRAVPFISALAKRGGAKHRQSLAAAAAGAAVLCSWAALWQASKQQTENQAEAVASLVQAKTPFWAEVRMSNILTMAFKTVKEPALTVAETHTHTLAQLAHSHTHTSTHWQRYLLICVRPLGSLLVWGQHSHHLRLHLPHCNVAYFKALLGKEAAPYLPSPSPIDKRTHNNILISSKCPQ